MGRVKLQIKRIESTQTRQVTFSKRRNGLIKKAYELCILCDIDIALIMFSPSGRVSHFSGRKRVEDVVARYINFPDHDRESVVQNREFVISTLQKLKAEDDITLQITKPLASSSSNSNHGGGANAIELQQEINNLQEQIQMAEEQLRMFEPDPATLTSLEEIEACERNLTDILSRVIQHKKYLMGNHLSSYDPASVQLFLDGNDQGMPVSFDSDVISWLTENNHNGQYQGSQIFSSSNPSSVAVGNHNHSSVTMYDTLSYGGGVTMPGGGGRGGCQFSSNNNHNLSHDNTGGLPPWHQAFTPSELLSALMQPGGSLALMKQELDQLDGVDTSPPPMACHQGEGAAPVPPDSCPTGQCSEEGSSTYESQIPAQINIADQFD